MAANSGAGLTGNTQTLTGTAAQIVGPASYSRRVWVYNLDSSTIYVGGSSGLTVANGFPISASGAQHHVFGPVDLPPQGELWGIGDASAEIRYLVQDGVPSI